MENQKIKPNSFTTLIKKKILVSMLCVSSLTGLVFHIHEHNEINRLTQVQDKVGINPYSTVVNMKVSFKNKVLSNTTLSMDKDTPMAQDSMDNMVNHEYIDGIKVHDGVMIEKTKGSYKTGETIHIESRKLNNGALITFNFEGASLEKINTFKFPVNAQQIENVDFPETHHMKYDISFKLKKGQSYVLDQNGYKIEISVL